MIKIKPKLAMLLLLALFSVQVHAQKAVVAAGGRASGSAGTVEYSIGQIDYTAISATTGSLIQGVQQPVASNDLPITLLSFKALKQENKVLLQWETATEMNSKTFEVQRSANGTSFNEVIGHLPAAGNSSMLKRYNLVDNRPMKGMNYYRVKETDLDGKFIFTKIAVVDFDLAENIAVIYPNPTTENVLLNITNFTSNTLSYKLFDLNGKLISDNKITDSQTTIELKKFPSATYYFQIINGNIETKTFKIIKSK